MVLVGFGWFGLFWLVFGGLVSFGWFCPIWFVLFVLVWFWSAWLDFGLSVEGGYMWAQRGYLWVQGGYLGGWVTWIYQVGG